MTKSTELRDKIVNDIIAEMEKGKLPWRSPHLATLGMPKRHNGVNYRGVNSFLLGIYTMLKGYSRPYWLTYKQAAEMGGKVRKGEKSSPVFYYGSAKSKDENGEENGSYRFLKHYRVFNIDQIEGLDDHYKAKMAERDDTPDERAREAMSYLKNTSIKVTLTRKPEACYIPSRDEVLIANPADMVSEGDFITTLTHELAHATGSKARLDRDLSGSFGSKLYGLEELCAEISACLFSQQFGIMGEHFENHAAYLQSWCRGLKDKQSALFSAAAKAQAAVDFINNDIGYVTE